MVKIQIGLRQLSLIFFILGTWICT